MTREISMLLFRGRLFYKGEITCNFEVTRLTFRQVQSTRVERNRISQFSSFVYDEWRSIR